MSIPLEHARSLTAGLRRPQAQNLFAQSQASYLLHEVGEVRENFPQFDPQLLEKITFGGYGLLAAGASLIEQGAGDEGRPVLHEAASLLVNVHGPHARGSRESAFNVLIASLAFFASGQYSRAFVALRGVEQFTVAAEVVAAFLRGNHAEQISSSNRLVLASPSEFGDLSELDDWAISVAIARALDGVLEFQYSGSATALEEARLRLSDAKAIASAHNHYSWWWIVRLLTLILDDLTAASPWTQLPPYFGPESEAALEDYIRLLAFKRRPVTQLWRSQLKALPEVLASSSAGVVVNLRTGGGKTRVAEIAALSALLGRPGSRVLYLAPFRSLAYEVEQSFAEVLGPLGFQVSHLYGGSRISAVDKHMVSEAAVFIATPEKARALLRALPDVVAELSLIVIDEGHLVDGTDRYVRNELFVDHLRVVARRTGARLLLLSAVLPNAEELALWVGGASGAIAQSDWKPAEERYGFLRWDGSKVRLEWRDELKSFNPRFIEPTKLPGSRRRRPFPADKREAIAAAAVRLTNIGPVMVFVARANSVLTMAGSVVAAMGAGASDFAWPAAEWAVFEAICKEELEEAGRVLEAARKGVVCHSNRLTPNVRLALEVLMRSRTPRVIVATTTLAQGVNIGVASLIVATPYISDQTITHRDFWNICGRAGRAYVDAEGKVLYAIDDTRTRREVRRDLALAEYFFERINQEPAESGLLQIVAELYALAGRAGIRFERLLELVAENDFSSFGQDADRLRRRSELVDDELVAMLEDERVNTQEAETPEWIDEAFRESLACIQASARERGVTPDRVIGFLAARVRYAIRVAPDAGVRKALASGGLPFRAALSLWNAIGAFKRAASLLLVSAFDTVAVTEALQVADDWVLANDPLGSGVPNLSKKRLEVLRAGWITGVGLSELCGDSENERAILRERYGNDVPWILNAAAQQLRVVGDDEHGEALAVLALLVELGLPRIVAAHLFLAGIRSRRAALELSEWSFDADAGIGKLRRQLLALHQDDARMSQLSEETRAWLMILAQQPQHGTSMLTKIQNFTLGDGGHGATTLTVRQLGEDTWLYDPIRAIGVMNVVSDARFPFATVANDPRVSFIRDGDRWRQVIRDPSARTP